VVDAVQVGVGDGEDGSKQAMVDIVAKEASLDQIASNVLAGWTARSTWSREWMIRAITVPDEDNDGAIG